MRLDRDDDIIMTGKRHDFLVTWERRPTTIAGG
jgi:xanthine dehydrogenase molybdopterin-binding subunit B